MHSLFPSHISPSRFFGHTSHTPITYSRASTLTYFGAYTRTYTHLHTHLHTHLYTHLHTRAHARTHARTHTPTQRINTLVHTHLRAYIHSRVRACTQKHTKHTNTRTIARRKSGSKIKKRKKKGGRARKTFWNGPIYVRFSVRVLCVWVGGCGCVCGR